MNQEQTFRPLTGWLPLLFCLGLLIGGPLLIIFEANSASVSPALIILGILMVPTAIVMFFGFQAIAPNDARVMLLFGSYRGSVKDSGFFWVNPFYSKKRISMRVRNFETGSITTPEKKDQTGNIVTQKSRSSSRPSKVNDRDGNPIEISAVVAWKVVNTAEALFSEHFDGNQNQLFTGIRFVLCSFICDHATSSLFL